MLPGVCVTWRGDDEGVGLEVTRAPLLLAGRRLSPIATTTATATATKPKRTILLFMGHLGGVQSALSWGSRGGRGSSVVHRVQDTVAEAGNPAVFIFFIDIFSGALKS